MTAASAFPAELLETCAAAAAVESAIELGVIRRVGEGAADPATVAADCGLTERGAEALLSALAGLRLFSLGGDGRFRSAFTGLVDFAELVRPWASLQSALRGDTRQADAATVTGAQSLYPDLVPRLAILFAPVAEQVANVLARHWAQILDVGAGAAPWSLALVARDPSCRVTAVELPRVMRSTREAVQRAGCDDRYEFVKGSAFDVDWGEPGSFDLALVANLCHLFDEDANLRLLGRVAAALHPGGMLAVVEILRNERGDGPRPAVLYALGLVLRTARGTIYPYSAFRRWFAKCGFADVRRHSLAGALPLSLITARRA